MNVKASIEQLMQRALEEGQRAGALPPAPANGVAIERPQKAEHGDFACSLPLKLAQRQRTNPMVIAETLASLVPAQEMLERVWAAPPGFVNFELKDSWLAQQVDAIRTAGSTYGNSEVARGQRVQVEFVSVNPTGPLHVGHARGAVIGSTLANILAAAGFEVEREYYINDAGNQMDLFNRSLYARYKEAHDVDAELPEDGYQGQYVVELAHEIANEQGDRYLSMPETQAVADLGELGMRRVIDAIRSDMEQLGVSYDVWFSERSLLEDGQFDKAMKALRTGGYLVERDGATWFTSTALGDEKDKVVVRSNGAPTYFATDVAYHFDKFFQRRFNRVIDVLGADHQGHVGFMKAVATALGVEPDRLDMLVYQLVTLKRGGETVRVSKRTGDLITVRELVEEVGPDPCRFFFLSRSPESQMEFDLELAKEQSEANPVYYVQYAHARIASVLRLAQERGIEFVDGDLSLLKHEAELALIRKMVVLPELVETMARNLEAHHLPHYAQELATAFHWFYQQCRVVSSFEGEEEITKARLKLVEAAKTVLSRCLHLMGMGAPERM